MEEPHSLNGIWRNGKAEGFLNLSGRYAAPILEVVRGFPNASGKSNDEIGKGNDDFVFLNEIVGCLSAFVG